MKKTQKELSPEDEDVLLGIWDRWLKAHGYWDTPETAILGGYQNVREMIGGSREWPDKLFKWRKKHGIEEISWQERKEHC